MNTKSNEEILDILKRIRLKTFYDLEDDCSNLDAILKPYGQIADQAPKLLAMRGKEVEEVLTNHASEFGFYDECRCSLKLLLDYFKALHTHERGVEYRKIVEKNPKALNDRAIHSLIDSQEHILFRLHQVLRITELYNRFDGILDSFRQRGWTLNNYTKHTEYGSLKNIL